MHEFGKEFGGSEISLQMSTHLFGSHFSSGNRAQNICDQTCKLQMSSQFSVVCDDKSTTYVTMCVIHLKIPYLIDFKLLFEQRQVRVDLYKATSVNRPFASYL